MNLTFKAEYLSTGEAMDGEILWVDFDTVPEEPEEGCRKSPSVSLSRNFEFPGGATMHWHDGRDYDGGATVSSLTLYRARVIIIASHNTRIDIRLNVPEPRVAEARMVLKRMLGARFRCIDTDPEPSAAGNRGSRSRSNPGDSARGA